MPQNGSQPDALKLACRITPFDAPELDISVVSSTLFLKAFLTTVAVKISRVGGTSLSPTMTQVDGAPFEYRWATQDQAKISQFDTIFPQMAEGAILISALGNTVTFNDSAQYGGSVGLANNVVPDCLSVSVDARSEAAGITNIHDLEVLEESADNECRGSSDVNGQAACDKRRQYSLRLNALGVCYGEQNQIDADMEWQPCDKNSNREDP